jgi:Tol biopolymer transport system component
VLSRSVAAGAAKKDSKLVPIAVMPSHGANQRQLTFDSQPKDRHPDWSPNGSKIAYLADTHGIADMGNSWGDIW